MARDKADVVWRQGYSGGYSIGNVEVRMGPTKFRVLWPGFSTMAMGGVAMADNGGVSGDNVEVMRRGLSAAEATQGYDSAQDTA